MHRCEGGIEESPRVGCLELLSDSIAGRQSKFLKVPQWQKLPTKRVLPNPYFDLRKKRRNQMFRFSGGYPGTLKLTARTCITEVGKGIYGTFGLRTENHYKMACYQKMSSKKCKDLVNTMPEKKGVAKLAPWKSKQAFHWTFFGTSWNASTFQQLPSLKLTANDPWEWEWDSEDFINFPFRVNRPVFRGELLLTQPCNGPCKVENLNLMFFRLAHRLSEVPPSCGVGFFPPKQPYKALH